jgi:putative oxidoreductase
MRSKVAIPLPSQATASPSRTRA